MTERRAWFPGDHGDKDGKGCRKICLGGETKIGWWRYCLIDGFDSLVLFMTLPGLALFYGGLVRAPNALSIFLQFFEIAFVVSLLWFALACSIAFGNGNAVWGGLG
jgi:hypothetical protein